jgi:hypothetical protein
MGFAQQGGANPQGQGFLKSQGRVDFQMILPDHGIVHRRQTGTRRLSHKGSQSFRQFCRGRGRKLLFREAHGGPFAQDA